MIIIILINVKQKFCILWCYSNQVHKVHRYAQIYKLFSILYIFNDLICNGQFQGVIMLSF